MKKFIVFVFVNFVGARVIYFANRRSYFRIPITKDVRLHTFGVVCSFLCVDI